MKFSGTGGAVFFKQYKMNELAKTKTLAQAKAERNAASIVEARKRNKNRIRKPEPGAQASRPVVADPRTAYLGIGVRYAKTWVSYWDFKEFLEGFEAYGHRLFDACVQNNDKELLAEYSMCLAELSAARSLALVKMLDELGDNPFPKEWTKEGSLPVCLEIHSLTAESLARVFVKLIPIVGQCGDPDSANEFFSAASSFFSRLAAAASVAGEEEERAFASEGASPAPDDPQPSPKPYPVNPRPAESKAAEPAPASQS